MRLQHLRNKFISEHQRKKTFAFPGKRVVRVNLEAKQLSVAKGQV